MDRDPAEQHKGDRHARTAQAVVGENPLGQTAFDHLQTVVEGPPAADGAPDDQPEQAGRDRDHRSLHGVGGNHRPQPSARGVGGGEGGEARHQPPRVRAPARHRPEQQEQRERDVAHHLGALLDLDDGAKQPHPRAEPGLEVLGVGEEAGAIDRHENHAGGQQPADRDAQPPGREVGDPVLVGGADHGHEVAAVDGGCEEREADGGPGELAGRELPLDGAPGRLRAQPGRRNDGCVEPEREHPAGPVHA